MIKFFYGPLRVVHLLPLPAHGEPGRVSTKEDELMLDESIIGRRISQVRRQKRVTLQDLARVTGLTKGYLSKVENSRKAAPVSTILKIAGALEISPSELFSDLTQESKISIVPAGERVQVVRGANEFGYSFESLIAGHTTSQLLAYILTIGPGVKCDFSQHPGEELFLVKRGSVILHYDGTEFALDEGDAAYFDSGVVHFGEVRTKESAEIVMVTLSKPG